jgi:DHA1 family inner membrane transport protein
MTSTTSAPRRTRAPGAPHFGLVLLALATGGFAIGTTEFVSMGLLPQLARGVGVSIPTAGHTISAYAVGVVVGAPLIAFLGSRWPRRGALLGLMALFVVGNLATAFATSYESLMAARFLAGLPHGAYFGVASLVAANLAPPGRAGRAVAGVMLGLSFANVVGVPAATWLGQHLGWEAAYWVVAALGLLTLALVAAFVPRIEVDADAHWRTELGALRRPQVIVTLLAGAVGFGGMFAVYTYVVPALTEVGGLPESTAPVFLLAFGLGMVVGTWLAGRLADWSVFRSLLIGGAGQGVSLLLFSLLVPYGWLVLPVVFAITALGSVMVVNLQLRLMSVSRDAPTMGAAMNHASLNVANALGAWLGGLVVAAGWGYRAPGVVGAGLAVLGVACILASGAMERRERVAA